MSSATLDDSFADLRALIARIESGLQPESTPEFKAAIAEALARPPISNEEATANAVSFILYGPGGP